MKKAKKSTPGQMPFRLPKWNPAKPHVQFIKKFLVNKCKIKQQNLVDLSTDELIQEFVRIRPAWIKWRLLKNERKTARIFQKTVKPELRTFCWYVREGLYWATQIVEEAYAAKSFITTNQFSHIALKLEVYFIVSEALLKKDPYLSRDTEWEKQKEPVVFGEGVYDYALLAAHEFVKMVYGAVNYAKKSTFGVLSNGETLFDSIPLDDTRFTEWKDQTLKELNGTTFHSTWLIQDRRKELKIIELKLNQETEQFFGKVKDTAEQADKAAISNSDENTNGQMGDKVKPRTKKRRAKKQEKENRDNAILVKVIEFKEKNNKYPTVNTMVRAGFSEADIRNSKPYKEGKIEKSHYIKTTTSIPSAVDSEQIDEHTTSRHLISAREKQDNLDALVEEQEKDKQRQDNYKENAFYKKEIL